MYDNQYKDHLAPADLRDAENYLHYCMRYDIPFEPELLTPDMIADLMLIKCRELSKNDASY